MKKIRFLLLLIAIGIIIFFISKAINTSQCLLVDKIPESRYYWMFDSSITSNLKIENAAGNINKSKYRFLYNYNNQYRYLIIEDEKFDKISLTEIKHLTTDIDLNNRYIETSEGFETWEGNKHMGITSNLCTDISHKLILNFNKKAIIVQHDSIKSISLEGSFESILFKNENEKNQYLIKYDTLSPSKIIFYKPKNKLYFILVTPFKDDIDIQKGIKNLNLK